MGDASRKTTREREPDARLLFGSWRVVAGAMGCGRDGMILPGHNLSILRCQKLTKRTFDREGAIL